MLSTNLSEISKKLAPIEIKSTLSNENLLNTICSMFLLSGPSMIYLTDEDTDGRIYFSDGVLKAAFWKDLSEIDALKQILNLDYAGVKTIKGQDCYEQDLNLSLDEFLTMVTPENIQTVKDYETGEYNKSHLINLNFIKGFLALENNLITIHQNIIPDAVPIDYLRSLVANSDNQKGVFCKISHLQGKQAYYIMAYKNLTWIFHVKKNAERSKLYEILSNTINKVIEYA